MRCYINTSVQLVLSLIRLIVSVQQNAILKFIALREVKQDKERAFSFSQEVFAIGREKSLSLRLNGKLPKI